MAVLLVHGHVMAGVGATCVTDIATLVVFLPEPAEGCHHVDVSRVLSPSLECHILLGVLRILTQPHPGHPDELMATLLVQGHVLDKWLRGGSWVVGPGSLVVGRWSWAIGRGSWVVGRGQLVLGRWSRAVSRGS